MPRFWHCGAQFAGEPDAGASRLRRSAYRAPNARPLHHMREAPLASDHVGVAGGTRTPSADARRAENALRLGLRRLVQWAGDARVLYEIPEATGGRTSKNLESQAWTPTAAANCCAVGLRRAGSPPAGCGCLVNATASGRNWPTVTRQLPDGRHPGAIRFPDRVHLVNR
jgi:hypothetical protein